MFIYLFSFPQPILNVNALRAGICTCSSTSDGTGYVIYTQQILI